MLTNITFFLLTFMTLAALAWSGYELFRVKEDPLGDRLEELQAHAMVSKSNGESRRRARCKLNAWTRSRTSIIA